jgi:hypothetical protein
MSDFSASFEIAAHFKRAFSTQWNHVLQQKDARFANAAVVESAWQVKDFIWQDFDTVAGRVTTGQRLGDTNPQEITGGARRGAYEEFDIPIIRDGFDNKWLGQQALPDGEIIMAMKAAANRWQDDVFLHALGAASLGGSDPYVTSIAFPAAQKVGVQFGTSGPAANIGLTPWKLLEATRILETNEIDPTTEELYVAITPKQKYDLVQYVADAPNDMWAKIVGEWLTRDAAGMPSKLMGYNVIVSNRLGYVDEANDIRAIYAFAKKAMRISPLTNETNVDRLPGKRYAIQFFSRLAFGAMRAIDKGVVQIACDQSPA